MRKSILIFLIFLVTSGCKNRSKCHDPALHEVYQIVRENALVSSSLDWNNISAIKDSLCLQDAPDNKMIFLKFLIKELRAAGDKHSFPMPKDFSFKTANSGSIDSLPTGKIVQSKIGYLSVNAFASFDESRQVEYATSLQHLIKTMDKSVSVQGWIIDLRRNNGGNMWPMVAGLGPLLGNGAAGYFLRPGQQNKYGWTYMNGKLGKIKVQNFYIVNKPGNPIAILIGNRTSSSGEMTLVAFLGKQNVKTFGLPTGGFVTANHTYTLQDGSYLNLATAYVEDRLNRRYIDSIRPDVQIYDAAKDSADSVIDAATKWIQSNP